MDDRRTMKPQTNSPPSHPDPLPPGDCVVVGENGRTSQKRNRQTGEKALERNL